MKNQISFLFVALFMLFAGPNVVSYQVANAADEVVSPEQQTLGTNFVSQECTENLESINNCSNGGSGHGNGPSGGSSDGACCGNNKMRIDNACWSCWEVGFLPGIAIIASGNVFGGIAVGI
jgi:hypothetical protein